MKLSITLPIDHWDPQRGGAERYLDRLCRDLCARGHQVTVLCMAAREDLAARPPGLSIERLPVPRFPRWRRELAFARRSVAVHHESGRDLLFAVRHALEADVYQPHGGCFRMARRGAIEHLPLYARFARRLVASWRPAIRVLLWLDREVFRRSPELTVVSLSRRVEDDFRAAYPNVEYRFHRLYHGVDTREFHDRDREVLQIALREKYEVGSGERIAVFLAHRFAPKGLRHALRAVARAAGWHLLVGGRDGPEPFRREARRLGIARRVHFLGPIRDPRRVLAAADSLVLPTYYDTFSLAVLEALACGTPVVTTKQCGAAELIESGRHGFVVEAPDRERELAAALEIIGSNWDSFHRRALALREAIDWQPHLDRMEEILRSALEEKRRRGC